MDIIKPRANFDLTNAPPEVPGSIAGSGDHGAHLYCGNSSDRLFWFQHSPKYKPSMKNPEWETFYVNRTSGPCAWGVQKRLSELWPQQKCPHFLEPFFEILWLLHIKLFIKQANSILQSMLIFCLNYIFLFQNYWP